MNQNFLQTHTGFVGNVKVEVDLSNYALKYDSKEATEADTLKLTAKPDFASLKAQIDKLDVDKLKTDPASLKKLSNVADNNVIKKAVYDKLIAKASIIDTKIPSTSRLVSKTKYDSNKESLQQRLKILLKRYLILVG